MLDFAFSKDTADPSSIEGKLERSIHFRAGKIVRIFGPSSRNCCATFLSEFRQLPVAWIDRDLPFEPDDLRRKNLDLEKILFIHGEEDIHWALSFVIRSKAFPIIVFRNNSFSPDRLNIIRTKLLRANAMMFLLSDSSLPRECFDEEFFAFEHSHFLAFPGGES
jgi:hypothetical protein